MEPIKKLKLATGEGLEKLPNGMPIPATLPPEQINIKRKKEIENPKQYRKIYRKAGEEEWIDKTLEEWDDNDFRIFIGNLNRDVTEDNLKHAFKKYTSIQKIKIVSDKKSESSKGFGFISFLSSDEYLQAFREMNGTYIGTQPIVMKKSNWKKKAAYKV